MIDHTGQRTLPECVPSEESKDFSCRTCCMAKEFIEREGKIFVRCFYQLKDFRESGCPSWDWKDPEKRDWMPESIICEEESELFHRGVATGDRFKGTN